MGAARVVLTMAVIGGAAGAVLAVATVPAFAPYESRSTPRPAPVIEASTTAPEAQEPAYDLVPRTAPESPFGELDVIPELQDGTVVVEVPQWTREGMEWMLFARRAMREWRDMAVPGEDEAQGYFDGEQRSSQRDGWQHEPRYGYDALHEGRPRSGDPENGGYYYGRPGSPPPPVEPGFRPAPEGLPFAFERAFPSAPGGVGAVQRQGPRTGNDDAAASAARRARQAAEDVLSAESAAQ
ncbi:hypothetical protein ABVV53_02335 [Novosphingobium sp. RD2P27]|uniref:Uncharacterized protein n=1 Tax=Novosphingobium kalidii TaxID=3230299 RepID=A0ABV2CXU8_9SPHN